MRASTPTARTKAVMHQGQSLGFEMSYSDGYAAFAASMRASGLSGWTRPTQFADPTTGFIATSGASMLERYVSPELPTRYWRTAAGGPGPLMTTFSASIAAWNAVSSPANPAISIIDWDQGQQDVAAQSTTLTVTDGNDFRDATLATLLALRTAANPGSPGSVYTVIRPLGKQYNPTTGISAARPNANIIRDAQLQVRNSLPAGFVRAVETWDLTLRDGTHPNQTGYRNVGYRVAMALQDMLGVAVDMGPSISSVTRSGKNISITISAGSGKTLVKPTSPCGFGFYVGASRVIPTSWSWSGNVLTASFATAPIGATVRFLDQYVLDWSPTSVIRYAETPTLNTAGMEGLLGEPLRCVLPFTVT